jgi:hypothetical protein
VQCVSIVNRFMASTMEAMPGVQEDVHDSPNFPGEGSAHAYKPVASDLVRCFCVFVL